MCFMPLFLFSVLKLCPLICLKTTYFCFCSMTFMHKVRDHKRQEKFDLYSISFSVVQLCREVQISQVSVQ
jgi:hypothetical protein